MLSVWNIIEYIYKRKILIAVIFIGSLLLGNWYVDRNQAYSAETVIQYIGTLAEEGLTENGKDLDPYEILSPNVVAAAIEDLGIKEDVDSIRKRITVTPIIPKDVQDLKEARIKATESYEYNPVYYSVKYTAGNDKSGAYARDVLDSVMNNYCLYYSEKYLNQSVLADVKFDTEIGSHDYLETAEILNDSTDTIITFLTEKANADSKFRSSSTGYSFYDLQNEYNIVKNVDLPILFADIFEGRITYDLEKLLKKYTYRKESFLRQHNEGEYKADVSFNLMTLYAEKNRESLWNSYGTDNEGDQVTEVVDNWHYNRQKAAYDVLVDKYVDDLVYSRTSVIDANYCDYVLGIYSTDNPYADKDLMVKKVEESINKINEKHRKLYDIAVATVNDYNEYSAMFSIKTLAGITLTQEISKRLYTFVAGTAGLALGMILAITVELLKKIKRKKRKTKNAQREQLVLEAALSAHSGETEADDEHFDYSIYADDDDDFEYDEEFMHRLENDEED